MALFTDYSRRSRTCSRSLVERGKLYQQTKDHAKAIADFTAAIAQARLRDAYLPAMPLAITRPVPRERHRRLLEGDRTERLATEYYYYRGLAHTATRAWDKAATDLTAATDAKQRPSRRAPSACTRLLRNGAVDRSLREYTIAIQQRPGFAEAYQGRSVVKAALGDSAGSQEDLEKIAR